MKDPVNQSQPDPRWLVTNIPAIFCRGLLMGMADVVPGVSGGTVALVLGIYHRLVTAISRFDGKSLALLWSRDYRNFAQRVDLHFLMILALGIAAGFVVTVRTIAYYLEDEGTRSYLLAAFFGMIIGALVIVYRLIKQSGSGNFSRSQILLNWSAVLVGAILALLISQMNPAQSIEQPAYWYLFLCGVFGICAMILPGISGALILMLLGVYEFLIQVAKQLLSFEELQRNLITAVCFAAGCATGLILFSRILRRLLEHRPVPTLSLLCGLIAGSLPQLWPFQINTTPEIEDFKQRVYQPIWPTSIDASIWWHLAVALFALMVIVAIELIAARASRPVSS